MLRVGLVTPSLCLGGAERWMISLASSCDPKRVSWTGTALADWAQSEPAICAQLSAIMPIFGGVPRRGGMHDNMHVQRLPTARAALNFVSRDADVLVTWGIRSLAEMRAATDASIVVVAHSSAPWRLEPDALACDRVKLVAVSAAAKTSFGQGLSREIIVLHNGIDTRRCLPTRSRAEVRREWGFDDDHRLVGYVGRLSHEKNPLAAARAVKRLGGRYRAVYVGSGRQEVETRAAVRELLGNDALILPATEAVGNVLAALDVFVLASPGEGFSLSLAEAWCAGVPTVATRVGAVPELETLHGQLVVPVPVEPTAHELAHAVEIALADSSREVVERARQVVRAHYTTEAMGARWTEYLCRIAGKSPPAEVVSDGH